MYQSSVICLNYNNVFIMRTNLIGSREIFAMKNRVKNEGISYYWIRVINTGLALFVDNSLILLLTTYTFNSSSLSLAILKMS